MASSAARQLFASIEADDAASVREVLAANPSLAAARDAEGVSALMRARYRSVRAVMDAILEAGAELDVYEATSVGDRARLVDLLDDPELARGFSADGFSALHFAAFFGKESAAEVLLEAGADPDARGRGWMTGTPLHSAASGRHARVVALLLGAGADPNARQSGGWTPLHGAAHNGDAATAELLLANGADPAAVNEEGTSVLTLARERGDAATIAIVSAALDA
jgi:ankyrin repeat protein